MTKGFTKIEPGMSEAVVLAIYAARIGYRLNKHGERVDVLEDDFTTATIELAQWYGWRVIHLLPARTAKGYRTLTQGDGEGFPDLQGQRRATKHRFVAELKCNDNKPTAEQIEWLNEFEVCGTPSFVWYPRDIDEIKDVLKYGAEWPEGFRKKPKQHPVGLL